MTIVGLDISKWNGDWNAETAKKAGAVFVFIKASQATFTDIQFVNNWKKAKEAGLLRGAYHYLDYTKPGGEQADYFADLLKDDPGELPPVVDYEQSRTDNNPSAALTFLRDFLNRMLERSELYTDARVKAPMIYTGPGFWAAYGDQTKPEYWLQFPLWNAHWITSANPTVPPPWTMWTFWQYTSKGPGETYGSQSLVVDMNRFNGTMQELLEFTGVRHPLEDLSEFCGKLGKRVDALTQTVANMNVTQPAPDPALSARVNSLGDQIANLGGTIATVNNMLSSRLTIVEQKIAAFGSGSTPPSSTTPTPPVPTVPTGVSYAVCTTAALNVRSGPGISHAVVAGIQYGTRVKVLQRQNGWAQIESPAGWCSEAYLSFEPATTGGVTPPAAASTYAICNTNGLNVRNGPGVTYAIVGGLVYGQRVKILSRQNGWAQIESPAGWCNETYLSF